MLELPMFLIYCGGRSVGLTPLLYYSLGFMFGQRSCGDRHAVSLEIQATIPSTPEKPSKVPMWRGVMGAYFIIAIYYFPVALICYKVFAMPVFAILERMMISKSNIPPGLPLRLLTRTSYVAFILFVGVTFMVIIRFRWSFQPTCSAFLDFRLHFGGFPSSSIEKPFKSFSTISLLFG